MELLLNSIKLDWPVLLPILICSILVVMVAINKFSFYSKNKRDVVAFIPKLQRELHRNNFDGATSHLAEFSDAIQVALDYAAQDGDTLVLVTADHETGGITYNAETDEYYYTTGSHTGVNVPVYVSATDAGFVTGEAYKNCEVSVQLARVMGCDEKQFPRIKN